MRISLFLPHVGVFGGVRRFVELGNAWTRQGHLVTLFHPGGKAPGWLAYAGRLAPLEASGESPSDVAFCADRHTLETFLAHTSGRHVYYCVIEKDPATATAHARGATLAANSRPLRAQLVQRYRTEVLDGIGGINLEQFHPDASLRPEGRLRVLLNGRRSRRKKGTDLILRALRAIESTPPLEIVLFDHFTDDADDPRIDADLPGNARFVLNPDQNGLAELYRSSHVFVAAERKAGWCNTALEAMASGAAVVCTRSGTTDFAVHEKTALVVPVRHAWFLRRAIRRAVNDVLLRERLQQAGPEAARPWAWDALARKLLDQIGVGQERPAAGARTEIP